MRAQLELRSANYENASRDLARANALLGGDQTRDLLFVRKWSAVVTALSKNDCIPLLRFRDEAQLAGDWESVREADLYLLKVKFDEQRFNHLYFGTPYRGYRERIARETGRTPSSQHYIHGPISAPRLDVTSGEFNSGLTLNAAKRNHQLFAVLLRDLYRPQSLGGLFSELFHGEHFNIFSSPGRIHQTMRRARRWIEEHRLPLSIDEHDSRYKLSVTAPFAFVLPLENTNVDWFEIQFRRMEKAYRERAEIIPREACEDLGLSASSMRRLASWATDQGKLLRVGLGPATRYLIPR
jgi:hypothetical protein